jgi:nitrogen-specific signal transduction histidine kinase
MSTTEDFARKVVEYSVDGLLVINGEGVVCYANPAANALFAHRTNQLLGFHLGSPAIHEPVEMILPGVGRSRHVEMRSVEITWEGQQATLASLRDITARKWAEEAMHKYNADLAERNEALIRFNRAAVGRELQMIELKREVNELCQRVGEAQRYRVAADESAVSA